jgi:hypothetical protein
MDYDAIIQSFPLELQPSMGQLVEALRTELGPDWSQVTHGLDQVRAAITDLSAAQLRTEARVAELGAAQLRTEARVAEMGERIVELGAAQLRTEARVAELGAAQLRTEARVAEMGERIVELGAAQLRTEARVAELGAAQLRTEGELAQLAAAQRKSEDRLDRLEETVAELVKSVTELRLAVEGLLAHQRSMQDIIAKHDGMFLEMKYRERPYSYFGKVLRRAKHVPFDQIEADLELKLSDADLEEITLLDVLIRGRPKRDSSDELWVAVEVSVVIDRTDVERVKKRTEILRRAGYRTVAVVAGEKITLGGEELAKQNDVAIVRNGAIELWDEALRSALLA